MIYVGFLICVSSLLLPYVAVEVPFEQKCGMFLVSAGIGWIVCSLVHTLISKDKR